MSRSTALRILARLPLLPLRVPRVLGVGGFALERRRRYVIIIDGGESGERIEGGPGRGADTFERWLRGHPGVEFVCRDGWAACGEAVCRARPGAVRVADCWHIWKSLCGRALAAVRSHGSCWATVNMPRSAGIYEQTVRGRWRRVYDLLGKGVGLLECVRRLSLALNTVKCYAWIWGPENLRRVSRCRPTLVDSLRGCLRTRRAAGPAVLVKRLFREIMERGWTGSLNFLCRYLAQGRAGGDRPVPAAQRLACLLRARPGSLGDKDAEFLAELTAACPEMTALARLAGEFAELLCPLRATMPHCPSGSPACGPPVCPACMPSPNGLELGRVAVGAGLTATRHNGRAEGVNTRAWRIMGQIHGRTGFALLRHRILLQRSPRSATAELRDGAGYGTESFCCQYRLRGSCRISRRDAAGWHEP